METKEMKNVKKTILTICGLGLLFSCGVKKHEIKDKHKAREMLTTRTLGLGYLEENKLEEAEAQFKKLIIIAPNEALGYANLGLIYLRSGKYDEVEVQARKALKYDKTNAKTRLILAKLSIKSLSLASASNNLGADIIPPAAEPSKVNTTPI